MVRGVKVGLCLVAGSKSEVNPTPASGPPARPVVPKPSAVKPKAVETKVGYICEFSE